MAIVSLSCLCGSRLSDYPEKDGTPTKDQLTWMRSHISAHHEVTVPPWWAAILYRLRGE